MNTTKNSFPALALLLDSNRGTFIPRDFVTEYDLARWHGINPFDIETCKDPDNEGYWDAWTAIMDNATFEENGHTWRLMQDGELWAYCPELMTDEQKRNWGFDSE